MNCREIQAMLHAYGDGELDAAGSLEVEKHIQSCPQCRQAHENRLALKKAIAAAAPYFKAPGILRSRIAAAASLQSAADTPAKPPVLRWQWKIALAMAVCFLLGFFASLFVEIAPPPAARNVLVAELASSHIRSLLADHLMDVASTDQHTVKQWFDGKLDFAPPVSDFAGQGYPLAGGRLDYIGGRTVAVLVYKKQKHFINLFIWPSAAGDESRKLTATKNGYNLVNWNHSGMSFWAVSDVNQKDLAEFAKLVTDQAGPAPK